MNSCWWKFFNASKDEGRKIQINPKPESSVRISSDGKHLQYLVEDQSLVDVGPDMNAVDSHKHSAS